jgi:uncharacterized OsmC-like protein
MKIRQSSAVNGIDVELLNEYIQGMDRPGNNDTIARLHHRWEGAFAVKGRMEELEERGEVLGRSHHELETDWPPPFSGDAGPTPGLELLLAAAGACASTTFVAKAALAGVEIQALEVATEGRLDLRGLFETGDGTIEPGVDRIRITLHVRSAADQATLNALGEKTRATSPVLNTVRAVPELEVSVRRLGQVD